jgi:hypothetical protein
MSLYATSRFGGGGGGGGGGGVTSLNGETGAIDIVAGTGITVTPTGQNIIISATGEAISSVLFTTITLLPSTTAQVFAVPYLNQQNIIVDFSIVMEGTKEAGLLILTTDGTNVAISSHSSATLPNGITFSAVIAGSDLILSYTSTTLTVPGTLTYAFLAWSDTPSVGEMFSNVSILDNTSFGTIFSEPYNNQQNIIIDYSINKSGAKAAGILLLSTNGSTVGISTLYSETASTGVTFSAVISGSNIILQYTSTFTGANGLFTYDTTQFSNISGSGLNGVTILDNSTNTFLTQQYLGFENLLVNYGIVRGSIQETGTLIITTDGINVAISSKASSTGLSGISFSASLSGNDIVVQYTAQSTGTNASATYAIQSWSDSPANESVLINLPNVSSGGGGSTSPAGSDTQIQFNQTGAFGASSNLSFDYNNNLLLLGNIQKSVLNITSFLDNQSAPVLLFSMPSTFNSVFLEYTIIRGTAVRTGEMQIATDGTIAISNEEYYTESQATGITLSVTLSGGNININYTSTATGIGGTCKYAFERW